MTEAINQIAAQLRERVRDRSEVTAELVGREVRRYAERSLAGAGELFADERGVSEQVLAQLTGHGVLQPLLDDPEIEEIWINGPEQVFIARNGVSEQLPLRIEADQLRAVVERMLAHTGRRIDLAQPFVDASLADGSRLHAAIPDITRTDMSVNIRKFHQRIRELSTLVEREMLSNEAAQFLRSAMQAGLNILVSGPTHAGKTTLLGALLAAGRPSDRVVTVEETFEISCASADTVAMQCRPANLEGSGEISLRRLVKEALRMRPDRLVVGEVREAESLDLLIALNSGIPGLATIHANSARDALLKLCTLPLLAGRNIDANFVVPTVASSIDLVVHCKMTPNGRRYVSEIIAPSGGHSNGVIEASVLFRTDTDAAASLGHATPELRSTGIAPIRREKFVAAGIELSRKGGPT